MGTVVATQTAAKINEFIFNFADWGGYSAMSTEIFVYRVCVKVNDYECIEICEDNTIVSVSGMLCNRQNIKRLGDSLTGGTYPIQYKVKYKGARQGIYSVLESNIEILGLSTGTAKLDIVEYINMTDLMYDLNGKRGLLSTVSGIFHTVPSHEGNYLECPNDYCFNEGACSVNMGMLICTCKKGYYGELCTYT